MDILNVELGNRSYPILIDAGLIGRADMLERYVPARDLAVVSNTSVAPLYLPALVAGLGSQRRLLEIILPDGEAHKTLANVARVLDVLVANRFGRDCAMLALGGGVVGDLAGFTPPAISAACRSCRCPPRSSRRSMRPSAARRPSTIRAART